MRFVSMQVVMITCNSDASKALKTAWNAITVDIAVLKNMRDAFTHDDQVFKTLFDELDKAGKYESADLAVQLVKDKVCTMIGARARFRDMKPDEEPAAVLKLASEQISKIGGVIPPSLGLLMKAPA